MLKIPGPIPIRIFPFFWGLVLLISILNNVTETGFDWLGAIIWAAVIIVSVLVHEFGHALTAVFFGQRANIELVGFGGVTQRFGPKMGLLKEFLIILNGPLAGFALCVLSFVGWRWAGGAPSASVLSYIFFISYYANLFWTVVNLLPVQPLDGGHLIRIFLEGLLGLRGVKISLFISFLFSVLISLYFFYSKDFLIGSIFLIFTFESYRSWQSSLSLRDTDRDENLQQMLKAAERDLQNGQPEMAITKLNAIRDTAKSGVLYITASHILAEALNEQENYAEAYKILSPLKNKLSSDSLRLLHQLAYRNGDLQQAISVGDSAYQGHPSYDTALINALCYGKLGEAKPAIGWLQCALREGVPDFKQVLLKNEFDTIRSDPMFQKLQEQAG